MILYEFFARFSSGLGFCALFRPTRRFSFIGLFRLSYLELVLLNPILDKMYRFHRHPWGPDAQATGQ